MTRLKIWFKHGNVVEYSEVESYTINNQTIEILFRNNKRVTLVPLVNIEEINVNFEEDTKDEDLEEFYKSLNELWNDDCVEWWSNL